MVSYISAPPNMKPQEISYATAEYRLFEVREVFIGDSPKGEFHLKTKDGSSPAKSAEFFGSRLQGARVGVIDPDGVLNLEYPIFIVIESEMLKSSIKQIFEDIDDELCVKYGKLDN